MSIQIREGVDASVYPGPLGESAQGSRLPLRGYPEGGGAVAQCLLGGGPPGAVVSLHTETGGLRARLEDLVQFFGAEGMGLGG